MDPEQSVLAQIQKQLSRCLSGRSSADGAEKLLELKCQIRNGSEYDLFLRTQQQHPVQRCGARAADAERGAAQHPDGVPEHHEGRDGSET